MIIKIVKYCFLVNKLLIEFYDVIVNLLRKYCYLLTKTNRVIINSNSFHIST